jgi:hypothetical protein
MDENRQKLDLRNLVPAEWKFAQGQGFIAVRCYRAVVEQRESIPTVMAFDVPGARLVLLWGAGSYVSSDVSVTKWLRHDIEAKVECVINATTPEGAHLLVICPTDGTTIEETTRFALDAAVAVALLPLGENVAHSLVCEFVVQPDGRPTVTVASLRVPALFQTTGLPDSAAALRALAQALSASPAAERPRLSRSLRWLADGMAKQDADGLLSMWIALEILVMEDTNIRPINERLAASYGIAYEEATRLFHVGRLYNLRSNIVHDGFTGRVSPNVTRYMRAVFMDCLCHELHIGSRCAESVLADGVVLAELQALGQRGP